MTKEKLESMMNLKIDATITIRESLATQFIGWALNRINGLEAFNSDVQAVSALSQMMPGRTMSEEQKLDILIKLEKLNVLPPLPVEQVPTHLLVDEELVAPLLDIVADQNKQTDTI